LIKTDWLTVEECIIFSAALRKHTLPAPQRKARTDEVTKALGLHPVQHNFIANRNGSGGISGGERRRVAVAIELVLIMIILCNNTHAYAGQLEKLVLSLVL
jgi:ABC-type multidrug transport system ATPase subunit